VRRGTLFVLAGPSGVGKGSVVQRLRARDDVCDIALSVSATTRPPRFTTSICRATSYSIAFSTNLKELMFLSSTLV